MAAFARWNARNFCKVMENVVSEKYEEVELDFLIDNYVKEIPGVEEIPIKENTKSCVRVEGEKEECWSERRMYNFFMVV